MCLDVEEIYIGSRGTSEESEEVIQIYRENKRKREGRREKVQEESFRFGCLVQPCIVNVLVLNWSAQSQDLSWGDTSSSDLREEPQEPQFIKNAVEQLIKRRFHFHVATHVMCP